MRRKRRPVVALFCNAMEGRKEGREGRQKDKRNREIETEPETECYRLRHVFIIPEFRR